VDHDPRSPLVGAHTIPRLPATRSLAREFVYGRNRCEYGSYPTRLWLCTEAVNSEVEARNDSVRSIE
jgi:hypothetical protein